MDQSLPHVPCPLPLAWTPQQDDFMRAHERTDRFKFLDLLRERFGLKVGGGGGGEGGTGRPLLPAVPPRLLACCGAVGR